MSESNKSRDERLAAALRENLRRRKAQSRANSAEEKRPTTPDESGEEPVDER